jgi:hypothetical protein
MPYQTCCTEIIFVPPQFRKRNISECIASLPSDSTAFIDAGFAADVEAAIAAPPGALGVSALGLFRIRSPLFCMAGASTVMECDNGLVHRY